MIGTKCHYILRSETKLARFKKGLKSWLKEKPTDDIPVIDDRPPAANFPPDDRPGGQ